MSKTVIKLPPNAVCFDMRGFLANSSIPLFSEVVRFHPNKVRPYKNDGDDGRTRGITSWHLAAMESAKFNKGTAYFYLGDKARLKEDGTKGKELAVRMLTPFFLPGFMNLDKLGDWGKPGDFAPKTVLDAKFKIGDSEVAYCGSGTNAHMAEFHNWTRHLGVWAFKELMECKEYKADWKGSCRARMTELGLSLPDEKCADDFDAWLKIMRATASTTNFDVDGSPSSRVYFERYCFAKANDVTSPLSKDAEIAKWENGTDQRYSPFPLSMLIRDGPRFRTVEVGPEDNNTGIQLGHPNLVVSLGFAVRLGTNTKNALKLSFSASSVLMGAQSVNSAVGHALSLDIPETDKTAQQLAALLDEQDKNYEAELLKTPLPKRMSEPAEEEPTPEKKARQAVAILEEEEVVEPSQEMVA